MICSALSFEALPSRKQNDAYPIPWKPSIPNFLSQSWDVLLHVTSGVTSRKHPKHQEDVGEVLLMVLARAGYFLLDSCLEMTICRPHCQLPIRIFISVPPNSPFALLLALLLPRFLLLICHLTWQAYTSIGKTVRWQVIMSRAKTTTFKNWWKISCKFI